MKQKSISTILLVLVAVSFFACTKPDYQTDDQNETLPRAVITGIKFHPGHYFTIYKKNRADPSYLKGVYKDLRNTPALKGIQVKFTWRELEKSKDSYVRSGIDSLLDSVKKYNKQLTILLELKSFHTTETKYLVPDYIMNTSGYAGGIQAYTAYGSTSKKGDVIKIWNQNVYNRFDSLMKWLGRQYNNQIRFEGIGLSESTFQCYPAGSNCVDENIFFQKLMALNKRLKVYFPNSLTYQFVNYPKGQLPYQASQLQSMASGWGGPDVFPTDPGLIAPGAAYSWYRTLSGTIPTLPSVQTADYLWTMHDRSDMSGHQPTIDELYNYAKESLKANYIFWDRAYYEGVSYFTQVLEKLNEPAIRDHPAGGLINTCPSAYASRGGCNRQ